LVTAAAVVGLSLLWLWWRPAPPVALSIGATLAATSVLSLIIAWLSAFRARPMEQVLLARGG
jgi:hypothetical protein